MKKIKIGDKYYIQDEQGILHQEEDVDKEIYNYLTSSYKELFVCFHTFFSLFL